MNDAGSLQNLNDVVIPGAVTWWPPAPGWYVLLGMGLVALLVLAVRFWLRWQRNRYRRQALAELSSIRAAASVESMQQLPVLLKRTALAVWRRDEVASLSGQDWHRFLDQSANIELFSSGAGDTLDRLAYAGGEIPLEAEPELGLVLDAAEAWLKCHTPPGRGV